MKTRVILIIIALCIYNSLYGQFTSEIEKSDIRTFLMLQGVYDYAELEVKTNQLYKSYIQYHSYKFSDLLSSSGLSLLSGIGLGGYESNTFPQYDYVDWLPKPMRDWYLASYNYNDLEPNYDFMSWQFVFREVDYIADRAAYDNWMKFYENKWWWALLTHWTIKNIAATIVKDTFKQQKPFYSFQIDLVLGLNPN